MFITITEVASRYGLEVTDKLFMNKTNVVGLNSEEVEAGEAA